MPECTCIELGWFGDGHDSGCALVLEKTVDRLERKRVRANQRIKNQRAEITKQKRIVRTMLAVLIEAPWYIDQEANPKFSRKINRAIAMAKG